MLIGDFNGDFCRDGCLSRQLFDFMSELDLCACDLSFCTHYTYERDDGLVRSWIDHVVCTNSFSSLDSDVYRVQLGSNLSDHYPLGFIVQVDCVTIPVLEPYPSSHTHHIDWTKSSSDDVKNYCNLISQCLPALSPDYVDCCSPECICHHNNYD